jgi:hypothetical protein
MQFVGLLLIINSLAGGAWWVASGRPQLVVIPICVAALSAGVFLMIYDRVALPRGASNAAEIAEGRPHQEGQAVTLEQLASENAVAKTLLADLQDQTAAADWHLNQLDAHINAMRMLPDGRTRVSNTVTGQAVILIEKLEALQKLAADRPAEAYALARECVAIYETTREQTKGVTLTSGDLGSETVAWLYATAATAAQRTGEHDQTLEWARAAVAARPTVERQFLLVTALINRDLKEEANALIQRELKAGGAESGKFRQFLEQYKIPTSGRNSRPAF